MLFLLDLLFLSDEKVLNLSSAKKEGKKSVGKKGFSFILDILLQGQLLSLALPEKEKKSVVTPKVLSAENTKSEKFRFLPRVELQPVGLSFYRRRESLARESLPSVNAKEEERSYHLAGKFLNLEEALKAPLRQLPIEEVFFPLRHVSNFQLSLPADKAVEEKPTFHETESLQVPKKELKKLAGTSLSKVTKAKSVSKVVGDRNFPKIRRIEARKGEERRVPLKEIEEIDVQQVLKPTEIGEEMSLHIRRAEDPPLNSDQRVHREVTKGDSVHFKPVTVEVGRSKLTDSGFEQSGGNRGDGSNFRQDSDHQSVHKPFTTYTLSLDLKGFSFKAGFARNTLSLSINFLNGQGITSSLIEEIETVIRSSGIALGKIQLKVKGRTVYSSKVKKEVASLELRV